MTDDMIHTTQYMTSVIITQEPPRRLPGAEPPARTEVAVEVARATVVDTEAVLAMVARCSRMTLFRRFHGPSDGVAYAQALLDRQPSDETLVAWKRPACIGLATLGRDEDGIAHLGVLVEDAWQRRGVGSRLVTALLDGARAKRVSRVHADVLGDDRFILRALRRVGPMTVSFELGTLSVDIDLGGGKRLRL
jgi:GNAT superfamily N-acetyltransferase